MLVSEFVGNGKETLSQFCDAIYDTYNNENNKNKKHESGEVFFDKVKLAYSVFESLEEVDLSEDVDQEIAYLDYVIGNGTSSTRVKVGRLLGAAGMVCTEISIIKGNLSKVDKIQSDIKSVVAAEADQELLNAYNEVFGKYNVELKIQLLQSRLERFYERKVKEEVEAIVGSVKQDAEEVAKEIKRNKEILSSLKEDTGFVSLVKSFKEYAGKVDGKISPLKDELALIKLGMLFLPVILILSSLVFNNDWKVYAGSATLMIVLVFLFRVNVKRQDQYEQILSKVENKAAMAIFHESQIANVNENDRGDANREFFKFVYSPIETNEWNVPDVADGIAKVAKNLKAR